MSGSLKTVTRESAKYKVVRYSDRVNQQKSVVPYTYERTTHAESV
jgi:BRCT domain type II-containing protein